LESYRAALAIIERLANSDFRNAGWQHDLASLRENIGGVLVDQDNLPVALESYHTALPLRERLSKTHPDSPGWQVKFGASYGSIGQILVRMIRQGEALDMFRKGRAIIEPLATAAPEQVLWNRLLVSFDREIGVLAVNVVGKDTSTGVDPRTVTSEVPVVARPAPAKKAAMDGGHLEAAEQLTGSRSSDPCNSQV
jgi:hypothetical protein